MEPNPLSKVAITTHRLLQIAGATNANVMGMSVLHPPIRSSTWMRQGVRCHRARCLIQITAPNYTSEVFFYARYTRTHYQHRSTLSRCRISSADTSGATHAL